VPFMAAEDTIMRDETGSWSPHQNKGAWAEGAFSGEQKGADLDGRATSTRKSTGGFKEF
jgi:hypothetical protein